MTPFSFLHKHKLRRSFNPIESPQYPPGHLLGLPCELRLQIYDALPLDCELCRPRRRKFAKKRSEREPPLAIPWLALILVCKTIADELRHVYTSTSGNTAYHLEVDNLRNSYSLAHMVTWRRIPCPPSSVRTLQVDLLLNMASRFWSSGGPSQTILGDLVDVLNHFIHNGPLLLRRLPLRQHIHLDTLIFHIRVIEGAPDPRGPHGPYDETTANSTKKRLRGEFEQYISRLVEEGPLFGMVDKIVCRSADGDGAETKGPDRVLSLPNSRHTLSVSVNEEDEDERLSTAWRDSASVTPVWTIASQHHQPTINYSLPSSCRLLPPSPYPSPLPPAHAITSQTLRLVR
ncbi:hypothetical protein K438DRAFT_1996403 [Mycena galopus ATCC 62051]|nr:hypothetical protein K438DRAFT_1996403 [Mycena galopus ATCC 62051]